MHFLWQWRHIFVIHYFSRIEQNDNYLNKNNFTSVSTERSISCTVVTPAKNGIGAVRYYFKVRGTIGIITFSHLKGKRNDVKAYIASPSTVFDCETKIT